MIFDSHKVYDFNFYLKSKAITQTVFIFLFNDKEEVVYSTIEEVNKNDQIDKLYNHLLNKLNSLNKHYTIKIAFLNNNKEKKELNQLKNYYKQIKKTNSKSTLLEINEYLFKKSYIIFLTFIAIINIIIIDLINDYIPINYISSETIPIIISIILKNYILFFYKTLGLIITFTLIYIFWLNCKYSICENHKNIFKFIFNLSYFIASILFFLTIMIVDDLKNNILKSYIKNTRLPSLNTVYIKNNTNKYEEKDILIIGRENQLIHYIYPKFIKERISDKTYTNICKVLKNDKEYIDNLVSILKLTESDNKTKIISNTRFHTINIKDIKFKDNYLKFYDVICHDEQ
jgi:hypothetical protein